MRKIMMIHVFVKVLAILSLTFVGSLPYPSNVVIDGDLYIVVMFGLTENGCRDMRLYPFQYMEAVDLALEYVNRNNEQLVGFKIGAIFLDDCSSAEHGLQITKAFYEGVLEINDSTGARIDPDRVVGFVGSESSDRTMKVAEYLKTVKTALVAPFATSPQLSDRTRFPYVVRTVPSDSRQGPAFAALFTSLGWPNVHVIIQDESSYAMDLANAFKAAFEKEGRCISSTHMLNSLQKRNSNEQIISAIINSTSKTDIVLYVAGDTSIRPLLEAKETYLGNERGKRLVFIGTESWGKTENFVKGHEKAAKGSISAGLYGEPVKQFDEHLSKLRFGQTSSRSVLTDSYFKSLFNCDTDCSTDMIITEAPTYSQDTFVMQVINAVLAIGKATLGRFEQKCNRSAEAICEEFGTAFGEEFTEALDNVCFTGIDGQDFAIRDGESFRAYNFFYWQEDGTPIKIGASGSEGRSYTPESKHLGFPEDGYYDKLPQSECSKKWCGYFCRRCRLGRNRNKLNSKCWDCSQARREGYPKCDACVPYGEEFKCFNCVEN